MQSECTRKACATLVPKRSVWISTATSARTSFTPVRSASLSGTHLQPNQIQLAGQVHVRMADVVADTLERLIESKARFDADDGEIERIGQTPADTQLAFRDHALEHEARRDVGERDAGKH